MEHHKKNLMVLLSVTGTFVLAILGLIAYYPGLGLLGSLRQEFIPMAPSTGLTFIIFSAAIFHFHRSQKRGGISFALNAMVGLAILFCLLEILGHYLNMDLNLENRIVPDFGSFGAIPLARMSPITGLCFVLSGIALLLFSHPDIQKSPNRQRLGDCSGWFSCMVLVGAVTFLLGYLHGTPLFYHIHFIPMAFTTALGFVFFSIALMGSLGKKYFPLNQLTGSATQAQLMRVFLPLILIAILGQSIIFRFSSILLISSGAIYEAAIAVGFAIITAGIVKKVSRIVAGRIDLAEISRKKAENALEASEINFKNLFELSPQPISLTHYETGEFIDANMAFCHLFKYEKKEIIGQTSTEMAFLSEANRQVFLDGLKHSGWLKELEMPIQAKDGTIISSLLFARRIEKKGVSYILTIIHDVTKIRALEAQLKQAMKMEAIGTLAGGIAHDFNNILGVIIGNTELAIEDLQAHHPVQMNLEEIKTASLRAKNVVGQLLSFSRKTEQKQKPIDILPIIDESVSFLRSSIPSTIDIRLKIDTITQKVIGDPTQIYQVLVNLSTNAAHAMEKRGGRLKISLSQIELKEERVDGPKKLARGIYIQIEVSDTGEGIETKILDKIFDPYFTTKEVGKGTGMGLAIVHGIVKNHNGEIFVLTKKGKGTRVKVLLPASESGETVEKVTAKALPMGTERILIVDDEVSLANLGSQLLTKQGYDVETKTHPRTALDLFQSNPSRFDLIITDMTMPELTGIELAEEMLKISPDLPIILCTGYSKKAEGSNITQKGIKGYLKKPFNKRSLAVMVREVLDTSSPS